MRCHSWCWGPGDNQDFGEVHTDLLKEYGDFGNCIPIHGIISSIHGSRANGTAVAGESDIDMMIIISDAEFDVFVAKRMELSSEKMKIKIARMVKNQ